MNGSKVVVMVGALCIGGFVFGNLAELEQSDKTPQERATRHAAKVERARWLTGDGDIDTSDRAEYVEINKKIARDVDAGYRPPTMGDETESDAQARILANCRAGFTDERAPATGSGTMTCDELEAKAKEDAAQ